MTPSSRSSASSTPTTSNGTRGRRSSARSGRRLLALLLLAGALAVAVAGIVLGSFYLPLGVVVAVVAVSVSAYLLGDETVQVRRDWARDRAEQAHRQTREATARAREHIAFADHMAGAVQAGRHEVERLLADLATAATSLAEAQAAHDVATRRNARLERELTDTRRSLEATRVELRHAQDALAESQAAELQTRAEVLAWEQSDTSRKYA
jgi:hypothetical protein